MTQNNTTGPRPQPDEVPGSLHAPSPDAPAAALQADCEYAPRVSAYHDAELSEEEARELSRHLAGCQACAAQLAFLGKVSTTFEAAPVHHLDADARQRLNDLGEEFEAERRRIKPSADVRWVRRLTAAAAILFVVAAGKVIYDQNFARHLPGDAIPAVSPHDPLAPPLPQRVSEDQPGSPRPASPQVPGVGKGPAVTDTDFIVGQTAPKPPTTEQTTKH